MISKSSKLRCRFRTGWNIGVAFWAVVLGLGVHGCGSDRSTSGNVEEPIRGLDLYPAWSPDGDLVAFVRERTDSIGRPTELTLMTVNVESGELDSVTSLLGSGINSLSWSPLGDWLVYSARDGIFKVNTSGDSTVQLTSGLFHISPSWSSTSNRIYYSSNAGDDMGIYSMDPDGANVIRWTSPEQDVVFTAPRCFPHSDTLSGYTFVNNRRCLAFYFPGQEELVDIPLCGFLWLGGVRVSPLKHSVAFIANTEQDVERIRLYLYNRSERSCRELVGSATGDYSFSPAGDRIVYPDISKSRSLKVIEIQSGVISPLTDQETVSHY